MSVRVKICGVTTVEDALLCADAGADAIGLNFWSGSKRRIDVERAAAIARALPPSDVEGGGVRQRRTGRDRTSDRRRMSRCRSTPRPRNPGALSRVRRPGDQGDPRDARRRIAFGDRRTLRRGLHSARCRLWRGIRRQRTLPSIGSERQAWRRAVCFWPAACARKTLRRRFAWRAPTASTPQAASRCTPGRKDPMLVREFIHNAKHA